ncbi:ShlB/FhaC/HecB family hemolysin secretion/activation protein [Novosphingobium sp. RD2P27]|uniref:ShlB/FhaC/HecB family hemolysin secretion/activation protein n=1 Tax=Novosphingobium kalidii TaxID=3230299 RepID=A0ABV2D2Q9_9SPHN
MTFRNWAFAALMLVGTNTAKAQSVSDSPTTALDRVDPAHAENDIAPRDGPRPQIETVEQPAGPTLGGTRYPVGAIALTGLRILQPVDFVDIIEGYTGRALTGEELASLAKRIADRLQSRGYIFASAGIAPQPLDAGVLIVAVDEGVIDHIEVQGDDSAVIRNWLDPLRSGRPVTFAEVERRLLLIGDLPGVWVRRSRYERRGSEGVLIVEVSRDPASGRVTFDNDGSKPVGPAQARIEANFNGLFAADDRIALTYQTTPFEPSELQYGRFQYVKLVSTAGTEVSVRGSYSSTEPGAYLRGRGIFGESWRAGLGVRHPLWRRRDASLWLEGDLESRELRQERKGILARKDRITTISVGVYGYALVAAGQMRARMTLSQGLDVLDATLMGDRLASRGDAAPDFTMVSGWVDWTGNLFDRFSMRVALSGQTSTTPLLITEEAGLGGSRFLRGYNYNERSGEQALMGSGELRYDWVHPAGLVERARLYAFADAGVVDNVGGGRGSGSLASTGGGISTSITRDLAIDLQLAFPLTGPRYDTDDRSPRFNLETRHSF